ncbi:cyclophilin peptidyl-prolyl cis-trans isomerase Cyp8 [Coemansia sp. RSA 1085]|nr:cyclophilin peptidyl-prolyl cis-trans isomerase Cyp8 [Coemansia sp. RSA 1085]
MGRGKDKLFITQGEWANTHGDTQGMTFGGKDARIQGRKDTTQTATFDSCALSLRPFKTAMCTSDGFVFDTDNITAYVKENHKHPFTDEPLEIKDLISLNYHRNSDGKFVDPVTFKQFSEFTKIAANKKSGNVYLWSTIEEFNIKPGSWVDLVTSEPFTRQDIVILQDPQNPKKVTKGLLESKQPTPVAQVAAKRKQPHNTANYSKGLTAASLTSTAMAPITKNESELLDDEEYMFARIKAKGYARMHTSLGDINLELHCDKAPRTCYNFIKLASTGYYNGTKFHRSIKNFMIQGGDPSGTGQGGKSCWGSEFKDEFGKKLSHSARGVLSMANRGPNTNTSQFFILYRAAKHLDRKHAIFGRVVGGLSVLDKMESISTDDNGRPQQDIVISKVSVFVDPFADFAKRLERKAKHEKDQEDLAQGKRQRTAAEQEQQERETTTWFGTKLAPADGGSSKETPEADTGVGKYLKKPKFEVPKAAPASKKTASGYNFGDFSNW